MDKRIFLPEGNGKKLTTRLNISRSQMDLALSGCRRGVKNYDMIRDLAKRDFNGMYKVCISGSEIYLCCQTADSLLQAVHEDYLAVSKSLDLLSGMAQRDKVNFIEN